MHRLADQQRKRNYRVTFDTPEDENRERPSEVDASEAIWTEKVKFSAVIEERQRLARQHEATIGERDRRDRHRRRLVFRLAGIRIDERRHQSADARE